MTDGGWVRWFYPGKIIPLTQIRNQCMYNCDIWVCIGVSNVHYMCTSALTDMKVSYKKFFLHCFVFLFAASIRRESGADANNEQQKQQRDPKWFTSLSLGPATAVLESFICVTSQTKPNGPVILPWIKQLHTTQDVVVISGHISSALLMTSQKTN